MNREVGDAKDGSGEIDQHRARLGVSAQCHPPGKREVAVEPGVEQRAPVGLDAELPIAVRFDVGTRLEAQIGGVRMRTDDPKAPLGRGGLADLERDEASLVANRVAPIARRKVPDLVFANRPIPRSPQAADGLSDCVIGRG